jgi:hypothetical protein
VLQNYSFDEKCYKELLVQCVREQQLLAQLVIKQQLLFQRVLWFLNRMAEVEAVATGNAKFGINLYNKIKQGNTDFLILFSSSYIPYSCTATFEFKQF